MKREYRLRDMIKEGILDIFYIWKDELKNVFKDEGVLIFFFLVPFAYPLLYSFIYNNEVVREAKMVVVDQSDSYLSRRVYPSCECYARCQGSRRLDGYGGGQADAGQEGSLWNPLFPDRVQ